VSLAGQRPGLDWQLARLTSWVAASGMSVGGAVTEVGSAMNGRRRKVGRLPGGPGAERFVVGHRDRLARFVAGQLQAALAARGRQIMILDPDEVGGDLVRDMTEVLISFCARLYGRGARNRAVRALDCAQFPGA